MLFAPAKDRRKTQRRWVAIPVVVWDRDARIDGFSINISGGGMYLFAATNLSIGDQIELEFRPPNRQGVVRTTGTVRRRALYLYAIEFLTDDAVPTADPASVQIRNSTPSLPASADR